MLEILREATVLKHDWVEDILDHLIGVLLASVDVAVLVIELAGTGNGLEKSQWNVREVGIGLYLITRGCLFLLF